jgi:hypothetical protein
MVAFWMRGHSDPMPIAAAESGAVSALKMNSAAQGGKNKQDAVAEETSGKETRFPVQNFYRFDYEAQPGETAIAAIPLPAARTWGGTRSFTITPDGTVHHTSEPRPATPK